MLEIKYGAPAALLTNSDAATYLGVSESSLEKSRSTGSLLGVDAPVYSKAGRSIRYLSSVCEEWVKSLPRYKHIAAERVGLSEPAGGVS